MGCALSDLHGRLSTRKYPLPGALQKLPRFRPLHPLSSRRSAAPMSVPFVVAEASADVTQRWTEAGIDEQSGEHDRG